MDSRVKHENDNIGKVGCARGLLLIVASVFLNSTYGFTAEELRAAQKIQGWYRANREQFEDARLDRITSLAQKEFKSINLTDITAESFVDENLSNLDSPDTSVFLRSLVLLTCFMNQPSSGPYLPSITAKLKGFEVEDALPLKRDAVRLLNVFGLCTKSDDAAVGLSEELRRNFGILNDSQFLFIRAKLYLAVGHFLAEIGNMDEAINYFNMGFKLPRRYSYLFHNALAEVYQDAANKVEGAQKKDFLKEAEQNLVARISTARTRTKKNKVEKDLELFQLNVLARGPVDLQDYNRALKGALSLLVRSEELSGTQLHQALSLITDIFYKQPELAKEHIFEVINVCEEILKAPDLLDKRKLFHVTHQLANLYAYGPETSKNYERAIHLFNNLVKDKEVNPEVLMAAKNYVNLILDGSLKTKDWAKALELSEWLYEHDISKERALQFLGEIFGNKDSPYKNRSKQIKVLEELVHLPDIQEFAKNDGTRKLFDAYVETEGNEERALELAEQLIVYYPQDHIYYLTTAEKIVKYIGVPQNKRQKEAAIKFSEIAIDSPHAYDKQRIDIGMRLIGLHSLQLVDVDDMDVSDDFMSDFLSKAGQVFIKLWATVQPEWKPSLQAEFNAFFVNLTDEEQDLIRQLYPRLDAEFPPIEQLMPRGHLQQMVAVH